MIILGFVVDDDGRFVDFAADTDDVAADDGGRITRWNRLRVGSRVALVGPHRRSRSGRRICSTGLCPAWGLLTNCAGLCRGARPVQRIRGSGKASYVRKLEVLRWLQAANELPHGADVDEPPGTIFLVHGVFVSLAHEAERTHLRLGEVLEGSRKPPCLAEMELHTAGILIPSPDHLFFFFALALGQNVRHNDHRGEEQNGDEEDDYEQSISTLVALRCRLWKSGFHWDCGAPCSSRMAVPRRPEETSSNSRLALPTFRMRKRLRRSSPSATTCTSSPSVKKARRALPLGTVPYPKNFIGSFGGSGGGGGSEVTPDGS